MFGLFCVWFVLLCDGGCLFVWYGSILFVLFRFVLCWLACLFDVCLLVCFVWLFVCLFACLCWFMLCCFVLACLVVCLVV